MNFFIDSGYYISDCKNSNNPSGMQVFRHKKISPPFANVLAWWGEGRIYRSLQLFSWERLYLLLAVLASAAMMLVARYHL
jgi:hypothetical protein